jgi:hypothetical protein
MSTVLVMYKINSLALKLMLNYCKSRRLYTVCVCMYIYNTTWIARKLTNERVRFRYMQDMYVFNVWKTSIGNCHLVAAKAYHRLIFNIVAPIE